MVEQIDIDAAEAIGGEMSRFLYSGDPNQYESAKQLAARHRQAGVQQGLDMAAGALEERAKATPLGHENIQRGASTYNWLMSHARLIRKLGANDGTD